MSWKRTTSSWSSSEQVCGLAWEVVNTKVIFNIGEDEMALTGPFFKTGTTGIRTLIKEQVEREIPAREVLKKLRLERPELVLLKKAFLPIACLVVYWSLCRL
jgi:hypothetical protein